MNTDTENIYFGIRKIKKRIDNSDFNLNSDRFDDFSLSDIESDSPINPLSTSDFWESEKKHNNKYISSNNQYDDNDSHNDMESYTSIIEPTSVPSVFPKSDIFKSSPKYTLNNFNNLASDSFGYSDQSNSYGTNYGTTKSSIYGSETLNSSTNSQNTNNSSNYSDYKYHNNNRVKNKKY